MNKVKGYMVFATILLFFVLLAAKGLKAYGGGVYSTMDFYEAVAVSNYTAVEGIIVGLGTSTNGYYTNGAESRWYRVSATNTRGRFPLTSATNLSWTGATNTNNYISVSWNKKGGLQKYILEMSTNGVIWTNWMTVSPGATNGLDYGMNTNLTLWTNGIFTNLYTTDIPAPTVPWSSTSGGAATNDRFLANVIGTPTAPAFSFGSATQIGMYKIASGISFAGDGIQIGLFDTNGMATLDGNTNIPSIGFMTANSDATISGFWRPGDNQVGLSLSDASAILFDSSFVEFAGHMLTNMYLDTAANTTNNLVKSTTLAKAPTGADTNEVATVGFVMDAASSPTNWSLFPAKADITSDTHLGQNVGSVETNFNIGYFSQMKLGSGMSLAGIADWTNSTGPRIRNSHPGHAGSIRLESSRSDAGWIELHDTNSGSPNQIHIIAGDTNATAHSGSVIFGTYTNNGGNERVTRAEMDYYGSWNFHTNVLSNVSAIVTTIVIFDDGTTQSTASAGGGDPTNWSSFAAISPVNIASNSISNVAYTAFYDITTRPVPITNQTIEYYFTNPDGTRVKESQSLFTNGVITNIWSIDP